MPHEEPSEEKPRVYRTEGGDLDRLDKPDIVGDDKMDVSRMADDEVAKTEASTSSSHTNNNNAARSTAGNPVQILGNGSFIGRHKTAFNAVSPSYITAMHPQAQMYHHFAAAQQYYNGLMGNRIPYASPHLTSPNLNSPSYNTAAFTGLGVYPSPAQQWLSALQFEAAAKAGFGYPPLIMGPIPTQISPNFSSSMEQLHMGMMFNARMESPFFFPSPLHSPDTGAPIAALGGAKVTGSPFTSMKVNGVSCGTPAFNPSLVLSPSSGHPAPSGHANHPLISMRQILVPPLTSSGSTVASSSSSYTNTLNGVCNGDGRPTLDKQTDCNAGPYGSLKRSSDAANNFNNGVAHRHQSSSTSGASSSSHRQKEKKLQHIKKPLNAFMLYMKEMRPSVMQEAGLKERQSAEINRILGRRWHSLTRDEQQKYYEMAKKERQEHLKKYPSWSARDNYAVHKKKKRKRDKAQDNLEAKKCRARFGLDQQAKWCKHCRRKKRCLWFKDGDNDSNDAADASPAAQVTSTSQFSSEDDTGCVQGAADNATTKSDNVNSPYSLVTSTTTHGPRTKEAAATDAVDDDGEDGESDSESDDDEQEAMTFSDEDCLSPASDKNFTASTIDDAVPPILTVVDNVPIEVSAET